MKPIFTQFFGDEERAKSLMPTARKFLRMLETRWATLNTTSKKWTRLMDDGSEIQIIILESNYIIRITSPFGEEKPEGEWSYWLSFQDLHPDLTEDGWKYHSWTMLLPDIDKGLSLEANDVNGSVIVDGSGISDFTHFPEPSYAAYQHHKDWSLNGSQLLIWRASYYAKDPVPGPEDHVYENYLEAWRSGTLARSTDQICEANIYGVCQATPETTTVDPMDNLLYQPDPGRVYITDARNVLLIESYLQQYPSAGSPRAILAHLEADAFGDTDPSIDYSLFLGGSDQVLTTAQEASVDGWFRYATFQATDDTGGYDFNVVLYRFRIEDLGRAINGDIALDDVAWGPVAAFSNTNASELADGEIYHIDRISFTDNYDASLKVMAIAKMNNAVAGQGWWFYLSGYVGQDATDAASETYDFGFYLDETTLPVTGRNNVVSIYVKNNTEVYTPIAVFDDVGDRYYLYVYKWTYDGTWSSELIHSDSAPVHNDGVGSGSYNKLHAYGMGRYLFYRFHDSPYSTEPDDWYQTVWMYDMVNDYNVNMETNWKTEAGTAILSTADLPRQMSVGGMFRPAQ